MIGAESVIRLHQIDIVFAVGVIGQMTLRITLFNDRL